MTKRTVFFLALVAALAAAPAPAQEFNTSSGVHTLRPLFSLSNAAQVRQAAADAERALTALLADITAMETARTSATQEAGGIASKHAAEQAALDQATNAFNAVDSKYRSDLTAFQQKQTDLEAEIQRQRNEAATVQALPSAQRDQATIERLNKWAAEIGVRRDAIAADRDLLMKDHERVEAERARVAKMRAEAEARLKAMRDSSVDRYGQADAKLAQAYADLRQAKAYLEQARATLKNSYKVDPGASAALDRATQRLTAFDARGAKR